MYGKKVELTEVKEGSGTPFLEPGIHKVVLSELKIEHSNDRVSAIAVVKDDEGAEVSTYINPYVYYPDNKVYGTQTPVTDDEQQKIYMQILAQFFSRLCPGGIDEYNAVIDGKDTFETMIQAIATKALRANGGNHVWQMIKANKKNFSDIAMHKGGSTQTFVEGEECRLKFDAEKFGKKEKSAADIEVSAGSQPGAADTGDLPF
jgi:predicted metal-binding protein